MKLTGRQRDFLGGFLDLYREAQEPLHYTVIAKQLGVSKITAYDMLRLLEKRGLVQSEYVLRGKGQGAGRSSIVFRPTPQADTLLTELSGGGEDQALWEAVKRHILEALETGDDHQDLLEELLRRLPTGQSPLVQAAEMITAVILSLHLLSKDTAPAGLFDKLRSLGLPGEAGIVALGGLAMGLSFVEQINRQLIEQLLAYMGRYQQIVTNLNAESKKKLTGFVREVMRVMEG